MIFDRRSPLHDLLATGLVIAIALAPVPALAGPPPGATSNTAAEAAPPPTDPPPTDPAGADGAGTEGAGAAETGAEAVEAEAAAPPGEADTSGVPDADRDAARDAFFRGAKAYSLGKYKDAIELFESAYELSREPTLLYNIGQAYWKSHDVEPSLDALRRAKAMFVNYDKFMRAEEGYDSAEVEGYLKAITAQIEAGEAQASAERIASARGRGPTSEELREERRRRGTRALDGTGITLIVLGSLAGGMALGGGATRGISGWMLERAGGSQPGANNTNTLASDRQQRRAYELGGQLAFAGIITTGVILPIGIGLKVWANARDKKDIRDADTKQRALDGGTKARLDADAGGLTLRF